MADLPEFRRFGAIGVDSACLEGWALYCEGLGVEMGLYQTPHQIYGRLDMEMWRACRLVVDTGLHTRRWTRDESIAYMTAHMALPLSTIESEVDQCYVRQMPAQSTLPIRSACSKSGDLRAQAQARLEQSSFDVRAFTTISCVAAGRDR